MINTGQTEGIQQGNSHGKYNKLLQNQCIITEKNLSRDLYNEQRYKLEFKIGEAENGNNEIIKKILCQRIR